MTCSRDFSQRPCIEFRPLFVYGLESFGLLIVLAGLLLTGCSSVTYMEDDQVTVKPSVVEDATVVDQLPVVVSRVDPEYPRLAREAGLEGRVWISALVNEQGRVANANVHQSCGTKSLDEAALKAAWDMTYKPAIHDGVAVATWITYVVEFKLGPY